MAHAVCVFRQGPHELFQQRRKLHFLLGGKRAEIVRHHRASRDKGRLRGLAAGVREEEVRGALVFTWPGFDETLRFELVDQPDRRRVGQLQGLRELGVGDALPETHDVERGYGGVCLVGVAFQGRVRAFTDFTGEGGQHIRGSQAGHDHQTARGLTAWVRYD